jgi:hypothetical protein
MNKGTRKPGSQEASKPEARPASQQAGRKPAQLARSEAGLSIVPPQAVAHRKATFLLSDAEFEGIEDLKLRLRREHGRDVTKNDLIRCAIQVLLEDYDLEAEASVVVQRLTDLVKR